MSNSSFPEPLEKIFLKVEEESERRMHEASQQPHFQWSQSTQSTVSSDDRSAKSRRRGSISITRFGQIEDELQSQRSNDTGLSVPNSPRSPNRMSSLASQSPFYKTQLNNVSNSSFASVDSRHCNAEADREHDHVTQIYSYPPKPSLSKAVGSFIPKRLSRVQSAGIMRTQGDMIIGVSVQETSKSGHDEGATSRTEIHAPGAAGAARGSRRRMTVSGAAPPLQPPPIAPAASSSSGPASSSESVSGGKFLNRAKGFTNKFRRKSKVEFGEVNS